MKWAVRLNQKSNRYIAELSRYGTLDEEDAKWQAEQLNAQITGSKEEEEDFEEEENPRLSRMRRYDEERL
jgi:hypothetical protein